MYMPKRSSRPRDINKLAKSIVDEATGEPEETAEEQPGASKIAKILGRLGGLKGGPARAAALLPEERKKIAKKAAEARWKKKTAEQE